jgi:hypothetical protein
MKNRLAKLALATGVLLLTLSGVAAANSGVGDGSGASPCGAIHGAFADVNGNFGFLGPAGGTPGYHDGAVGQDQGATGFNNSTASATCTQ